MLITGHTGFKGSWLSLCLDALGADVHGFALEPPTEPSLYRMAGVGQRIASRMGEARGDVRGDVRDYPALRSTILELRPAVIFHLAAQSLVRHSYHDPLATYSTNVMGTVHLLEAVRELALDCALINVTSDKCYENRRLDRGYREDEPLGGSDPYSASKAAQELVAHAYRRSFGLPLATGRAGNVIGGGDWGADRLVPDIVRAGLEGEEVRVRNPNSVRPWQHVLNPLSGYLVLAQALFGSAEHAAGWNFGPAEQDARPVGWLVERIAELWPAELRWTLDDGPHPHEASYLKLDSSRARLRLGWRPPVALDEALASIVEWYQALRDGADMRAVTLAQIEAFSYAPDSA